MFKFGTLRHPDTHAALDAKLLTPADMAKHGLDTCVRCDEPILEGEGGYVMPFIGMTNAEYVAYHEECHLRTVLGSVEHQQGLCSCRGQTITTGADTNHGDPPNLTRRQEARAAEDHWFAGWAAGR